MIWWDIDGLAIFYKRLEDGGFSFPMPAGDAEQIEMTAADLQLVLQGIDPAKVKRTKRYQRPASHSDIVAVTRSRVRRNFSNVL